MTNLISQAFKNKEKKLVTFVTGGDPDLNTSLEIIKTIINNGVDIIEIGMPFSDPMADGPTIQLSSNRAISEGINLENIFSLASKAKEVKGDLPIILMGYYNLILHFGIEPFVKKCKENDSLQGSSGVPAESTFRSPLRNPIRNPSGAPPEVFNNSHANCAASRSCAFERSVQSAPLRFFCTNSLRAGVSALAISV